MYETQLQHNVLHVCVCMYGILFIVLAFSMQIQGEGVGGHITCSSKFQVEEPWVGGTYLMKDLQNLLCHVHCLR